MKSLLITLTLLAALQVSESSDRSPNEKLNDAGAPIFHACKDEGQLLVTGRIGENGDHIIFTGEDFTYLLRALNFDPEVRQAILDGVARAKIERESDVKIK